MKRGVQEGAEGADVGQLQKYLPLLQGEDAVSVQLRELRWAWSMAEEAMLDPNMYRLTQAEGAGVSATCCCVTNSVT